MLFKIRRIIPNTLTLSRIVLTCVLNCFILLRIESIMLPILFSIVIFLTDFLDGKIARFFGLTSRLGAILDVCADLIYIVTSYICLIYLKIAPLYFIFIILFKFIEFVVTSHLLRQFEASEKSIFVFDLFGRISSILFYILPLLLYVSHLYSKLFYLFLINQSMFLLTIIVLISSCYRISTLIHKYKDSTVQDQKL